MPRILVLFRRFWYVFQLRIVLPSFCDFQREGADIDLRLITVVNEVFH